MLTEKDIQVFEETGNITPERLKAAQYALRKMASDAYNAALAHEDERGAAALRGKKTAYFEAARMLGTLLAGNPLPIPRRAKHAMRRERVNRENA